jgi:hypothetical protein
MPDSRVLRRGALDEARSLSAQQLELAKGLAHSEIPDLEWFLTEPTAELRNMAAYAIRLLRLGPLSHPLPATTVAALGALLRDPHVRAEAFIALHEAWKLKDNIQSTVDDLVAAIPALNFEGQLAAIDILGTCSSPSSSVVAALQALEQRDNPGVATHARQALARIGVNGFSDDDRAAVQALLHTWRSSTEAGLFEREEAERQLRVFPRPLAVAEVFTATLLSGQWASGATAHRWPAELSSLLADIGDARLSDCLFHLYLVFQAKPPWTRWSGYFAEAILRLPGGWESARASLTDDQQPTFFYQAITSNLLVERVKDYPSHLSAKEVSSVIAKVLAEETNPVIVCGALARLGGAALDPLLALRAKHPKEAAWAICRNSEALNLLSDRASGPEIEDIIAKGREYGGKHVPDWVLTMMAKVKTPRCLGWLREERAALEEMAASGFPNRETLAARRALVQRLLADVAD